MAETPRQRILRRLSALKSERSSWESHWRELNDYVDPTAARFYSSQKNDGGKKHGKIINSTARRAHRILSAGLMAGASSPARPWFRLTTPDPSLAEFHPVRAWLHVVEEVIRSTFARTNIYNCLHTHYEGMGQFSTSAMHVDEDEERVLLGYNLVIGEYCLILNAKQVVVGAIRELTMKVDELVEKFGLEACSVQVQRWYRDGHLDKQVDVVHVVEPNRSFEPGRADAAGKKWVSVWMEKADPGNARIGFLRESGYEENPIIASRWCARGGDTYGTGGPGMDALGDIKALQEYERRKAQLVQKIVEPPMRGPASMQNAPWSLLPGAITYVDGVTAGTTFEPAVEIQPQALVAVGTEIQRHEERINGAFYADLWLAMLETDRGQITAREVAERHEEKLIQLGPMYFRLEWETLSPLIDRAFGALLRAGRTPPPPAELQGIELRVDFISPMAQAQKLLGVTGIERLGQFTIALSQARPDALDKLNVNEMVDSYAEAIGISPDLVLSDDQVEQIRAERARQQQAQQMGEALATAAQGAKDLAGAGLENDNALSRMVGAFGGSVPGGGA